ncbi:cytochrome C [Sulfurifustis variabilis]|uniref:Cytochrome C n=1 Tax=Sulfurifustis variabilis TaxID=1675686 RepID=A0A1B4UZP9_9GAMM|nr:c-type cytochrome [Sulfurifustis variabilis]BAU46618.1 cytochrome C [Sulfurifustis variabilis]
MSDREFLKFFSGLMGALVVLTVVLFVLARIIGGGAEQDAATAEAQAVAERIRPIGEVAVGQAPQPSGMSLIATANAAAGDKGKQVYDTACAACHAAGVAGAPKLGDKSAWKPRIAQGNDTLYTHAIKGFQGKTGFMPPKGGNASLADADVKAAVDFMVAQSK